LAARASLHRGLLAIWYEHYVGYLADW
jgi:hypothetical protein